MGFVCVKAGIDVSLLVVFVYGGEQYVRQSHVSFDFRERRIS